jgi:HPt (histidine-containing phosphotransfer) domain-containing protein
MVALGKSKVNHPVAEPPIVDLEQIDGLLTAAGARGAREILSAFWKSTESLLQTLNLQLAASQFREAGQTAHALKGSALNVGAVRISRLARSIEESCKALDGAAAIRECRAADREYLETVKAFDALIEDAERRAAARTNPPAA